MITKYHDGVSLKTIESAGVRTVEGGGTGANSAGQARAILGAAADAVFAGATQSAAGTAGLVPAPIAGDQDKYLKADGTWATVSGGGGGAVTSVNGETGAVTLDAADVGAEPAITTLPISKGGTGATTIEAARANLGITGIGLLPYQFSAMDHFNGSSSPLQLTAAAMGGGAANYINPAGYGGFGIFRIETANNTNVNTGARINQTGNTISFNPKGTGELRFVSRVMLASAAMFNSTIQGFFRTGIGDVFNGQPNNGIYFQTISSNSVSFVTRNAGVETLTNTGISIEQNQWSLFEFILASDGLSVTAKINNNTVATHTTDITNAYTGVFTNLLKQSSVAGYVQFDVDLISLSFTPNGYADGTWGAVSGVTSVNGQAGEVVLTPESIGAASIDEDGNLPMWGGVIKNLGEPIDDDDAVRKIDLNPFLAVGEKGAPNGIATLDSGGMLSPDQMPRGLDGRAPLSPEISVSSPDPKADGRYYFSGYENDRPSYFHSQNAGVGLNFSSVENRWEIFESSSSEEGTEIISLYWNYGDAQDPSSLIDGWLSANGQAALIFISRAYGIQGDSFQIRAADGAEGVEVSSSGLVKRNFASAVAYGALDFDSRRLSSFSEGGFEISGAGTSGVNGVYSLGEFVNNTSAWYYQGEGGYVYRIAKLLPGGWSLQRILQGDGASWENVYFAYSDNLISPPESNWQGGGTLIGQAPNPVLSPLNGGEVPVLDWSQDSQLDVVGRVIKNLGAPVDANDALRKADLADFTGATSSAAGVAGLVPTPIVGDQNKYLKGDGTWATVAAGTQVQTDWNATTGLASIANKPTIPAAQVQTDWNATTGLASIANKPTIPAAQVQTDWDATTGLASIANKPTIPAAQIQSDWSQANNNSLDFIRNKPTLPSKWTIPITPNMPYFLNATGTGYADVASVSIPTSLLTDSGFSIPIRLSLSVSQEYGGPTNYKFYIAANNGNNTSDYPADSSSLTSTHTPLPGIVGPGVSGNNAGLVTTSDIFFTTTGSHISIGVKAQRGTGQTKILSMLLHIAKG